jgi:hypothetical protein
VRVVSERIERYGLCEIALDVQGEFDNPFDPREIAVDAQFRGPGGVTRAVPGFLYQECARELGADGVETVTPQGAPSWRVRFCPTEVGEWECSVTATDRTGTTTSPAIRFSAAPSESHGFLRRSTDSRYFQYEDGTPVSLIGLNIAWSSKGGTYEFDPWLTESGKAGINLARIWLQWNQYLSIETKQSGCGRYDLSNAWRMDHVLQTARESGVRVLFCCDSPEPYQKEHYWLGKLTSKPWTDSCPHNVANGGPMNEPEEFYTTEEGHRLIRQRLRYIAARWGYDTNILCWELWNELNCFPGWTKLIPEIVAWHKEMAGELRRWDPNQHLITTSFGNAYGDDTIWQVPELDFVQSHLYAFRSIGAVYPEVTNAMHERYGRPHIVGEFGPRMEELAKLPEWDPKGVNLRDGIWSTMLGGGGASALTWCWDFYVHKLGLYSVYTPLAKFCEGIPWPTAGFRPAEVKISFAKPQPPAEPKDLVVACGGAGLPQLEGAFRIDPTAPPEGLGRVYLYGVAQKDQQKPITLELRCVGPTQMVLNIGRVWVLGILGVKLDGSLILRKELPAGPPGEGPWKKAEFSEQWKIWASDYDLDIPIDVPAGEHRVELYNAGKDGITIDRITLPRYVTETAPPVRVVGMVGTNLAVLWLQNKASDWGTIAERAEVTPARDVRVTVAGIPPGPCEVEWWSTTTGDVVNRENLTAGEAGLALEPPVLEDDIACKVTHDKSGGGER